MSNAQRDGMYLMLIGTLIYILLGMELTHAAPSPMADFKAVYFPARALLAHHDPYMVNQVTPIYEAERAGMPPEGEKIRQIATWGIYRPAHSFWPCHSRFYRGRRQPRFG